MTIKYRNSKPVATITMAKAIIEKNTTYSSKDDNCVRYDIPKLEVDGKFVNAIVFEGPKGGLVGMYVPSKGKVYYNPKTKHIKARK